MCSTAEAPRAAWRLTQAGPPAVSPQTRLLFRLESIRAFDRAAIRADLVADWIMHEEDIVAHAAPRAARASQRFVVNAIDALLQIQPLR